MRIGIPTEVKNHEYRVSITAGGVRELIADGHQVVVQSGAGVGSNISDADYQAVGAEIEKDAATVWNSSDLILKVKEPIESEYQFLREGLQLFTYLHLAADKPLTERLLETKTTSIAYETVVGRHGGLPLLAPMSEIAGKLAAQVGAYHAMRPLGGRGILAGGVPGVSPANVVVIGGGVAGLNAARVSAGLGARVEIFDVNVERLQQIDDLVGPNIQTRFSNLHDLELAAMNADIVIGAVLVPGAKAPRLLTNAQVAKMRAGSVLIDISIDQGGCFEDSHKTTHSDPTFRVHDSVFYCVANMPGAVPTTSTPALSNVTLPYARAIAKHGWLDALRSDAGLGQGLHTHAGVLFNGQVGQAHGISTKSIEEALV